MKFGISIPTGRQGLYLPSGFASAEQLVELGKLAEGLGFHSVWGNDHLNLPRAARHRYETPPMVYEVLVSLAFVAAATSRIRLGAAALSLPLREPVLLAKQMATLDVFSKGRLQVAVGVGQYREEFEGVSPRQKDAHRASMLEEMLQALKLLFNGRNVSFKGKYYEFQDIDLWPKPIQSPLPIYITGTSPKIPERVVQWGNGWLMTYSERQTYKDRIDRVRGISERRGRDFSELDLAATAGLSIDVNSQRAQVRLSSSLLASGNRGAGGSSYPVLKFVGTPSEVVEGIHRLGLQGITHCVLQDFAVSTLSEMKEQIQMFGEEVIPSFR